MKLRSVSATLSLLLAVGFSLPACAEAEESLGTSLKDSVRLLDDLLWIQKNTLNKQSNEEFRRTAFCGTLRHIDPHSQCFTAEEFKKFGEQEKEEFGGIGLQLEAGENGTVIVVAPMEGTPAFREGFKPGDLIIAIDSDNSGKDEETKLVAHLDGGVDEVVKLIKGKPGTKVTIIVLRAGEGKTKKITLTREIIRIPAVKSELLPGGYGVIKINTFMVQGDEFQLRILAEHEKLVSKNKGKPVKFVLDLRNNSGGHLYQALSTLKTFNSDPEHKLLLAEHRGGVENVGKEMSTPQSKSMDMLNGAPMWVLINRGSASASEIVAGGLQMPAGNDGAKGRAVILGTEPSFGKATIQQVFDFKEWGAAKITIAQYLVPSKDGASCMAIQNVGVVPDILVVDEKENAAQKGNPFKVTEKSLSGISTSTRCGDAPKRDLANEDPALYAETLEVMKALGLKLKEVEAMEASK